MMTREQSIRFHLQIAYSAGVIAGRDGIAQPHAAGQAIVREIAPLLERDLEVPPRRLPDPLQRLWYATDGRRCACCPLPLIAHLRGIAGHEFIEAEHALEAVSA